MTSNETTYLIILSKLRLSLKDYNKESYTRHDREYIPESFMTNHINYYIGSYVKSIKNVDSILNIIKKSEDDFINYFIDQIRNDKGLVYLFLTMIIDHSSMDDIKKIKNFKKLCKCFTKEMAGITEATNTV